MADNHDITVAPEDKEGSIDWMELISILWVSRKLIGTVTGVVTVGAVVISLFLPEYFRSTATLLPETEKSKLAALGGFSDLAALAGISTGEASLAKLYPDVIRSESVLKNVIFATYKTNTFPNPVNLIQFWGIDETTPERSFEVALRELRGGLDISLDTRTSIVSLSIDTREAQLSADILNNVTAELDEFIRTKRTSNASDQRKWIEERLVRVKQDLGQSEDSLKKFREGNRRVGDSPQLLLEQERLIREVQINAMLYTELKKQYELARIEEIKNVPIVSVMDPARPATRKDRPKRVVLVLYGFFLGFSGGILYKILEARYASVLGKVIRQLREVHRN